jgi:lipid-binding SYLF domain-containing protein
VSSELIGKGDSLGVGASYGRGAMSCRSGASFTGPWGPPAMYALEGGNIGFQIGGQATDFVLLVVNPKGVDSIFKSKVKLGADASAAAEPKGRDTEAATDVLMHSEIMMIIGRFVQHFSEVRVYAST